METTTQDIISKIYISTSESLIHSVSQEIKGCRLLENLDIALFKYLLMLSMSCAVWKFIEHRGIEIRADKYSRQHSNNRQRSIFKKYLSASLSPSPPTPPLSSFSTCLQDLREGARSGAGLINKIYICNKKLGAPSIHNNNDNQCNYKRTWLMWLGIARKCSRRPLLSF